jgi:hypothetical protein
MGEACPAGHTTIGAVFGCAGFVGWIQFWQFVGHRLEIGIRIEKGNCRKELPMNKGKRDRPRPIHGDVPQSGAVENGYPRNLWISLSVKSGWQAPVQGFRHSPGNAQKIGKKYNLLEKLNKSASS